MKKFLFIVLSMLGAAPASAQQHMDALVVSSCGSVTYIAATYGYLTQDTTGKFCDTGGGGGGGSTTANQGTPGSVNAGWPTIGGELTPDITGTFTNVTQTTSITAAGLDGYGTALISISGTYGTATAVFELSDDGGTTWYAVQASRINSCVVENGYASLTNINQAWIAPVSGADSFRVRSTAVASGTANIRISISSAVPPNAATVCGTAATKAQTTALAANLVVNASAANLYSLDVAADSTLSGAAWWIMIYDATAAPVDGAVTPAKCISLPSGVTAYTGAFPNPVAFGVGIVIGVSTTGCFIKTASTHAFISGDFK